MAEQTYNEALHGDEVIEAIVDRLRRKLKQDCYLNPNSSYDYFTADISLTLVLHDQGVDVPTSVTVEVVQGARPDDDVEVQEITGSLDIEAQPPNVVREETGQPIPVISTNAQGKTEIKRVSYGRPSAKSAAKRAAATVVLLALAFGHHAGAQQFKSKPATPAPPPTPQQAQAEAARAAGPVPQVVANPGALTQTEVIAVTAVVEEQQRLQQSMTVNQQKMQLIEADITRAHPGFHLDMRTGALAPNQVSAPPAPTPAAPAPSKPNK